MVHVPMTQKDSIVDQVERLQQDISRRAYDRFLERGVWSDPWTDWFAAEREIVHQPVVEVRERDGMYSVSARLDGFDPREIQVDITSTALVIKAKADGEAHRAMLEERRLFGTVRFPKPVDTARARAEWRAGLLSVTAPIAVDRHASRPERNVA